VNADFTARAAGSPTSESIASTISASYDRAAGARDDARQPRDAGCMIDAVREYDIVLIPEDKGGFSVVVPDPPGVYTQGEARDEALAMAKEAIEVFLDSLADEGKQPQPVRHGRVAVSLHGGG
jgi:antitoxin HicB